MKLSFSYLILILWPHLSSPCTDSWLFPYFLLVSTHVSHDIISVVLEARDQYHLVTGSWQNPSHYCEGRAEYDLKGNFSTLFEAKWMSSNSTDITAVKIK